MLHLDRWLGSLVLFGALTAQSTRAELEPSAGTAAGPLARAMDAAAARGLQWLASQQQPGGAWTGDVGHKRGDDYLVLTSAQVQQAKGRGHVGVTALAGLAFLAGGHLPGRGPFGEPVGRALDYVIHCIGDNGMIQDSGTRMYSHAFATLFLAEIYGMAEDDRVKQGLEQAVHWIVDTQNRQGGWRYNPFTTEADLSVTVCQLQALRAARNIGIQVPGETMARAVDYVLRSRVPEGHSAGLFWYKIEGRGAYEKSHDYAINAAACTSLYSAGVYDRDLIDPALRFLEDEYPYIARYYRRHFYFYYGSYYAAQAFFQTGGTRFDRWHELVCRDLLADQQADGRWRNDVGPGDEFATAIACLLLQVRHQYLPIFQR